MRLAKESGYSRALLETAKRNKQEVRQLYRSNEHLAERLKNATEQMRLTKEPRVNPAAVAQTVKEVVQSVGSRTKPKAVYADAQRIYNDYFKAVQNAGGVMELEAKAMDNMISAFQSISERILEKAELFPEFTDYDNLRTYLRSQPIRVAEEMKPDVNYAEFRKAHMGTLNLTNTGTPVDVVYQELCALFPHLFDEQIANPADQLLAIVDTMNGLDPRDVNIYQEYGREAMDFVTEQLAGAVDSMTLAKPTKADKMAARYLSDKQAALERQRERLTSRYEGKLAKVKERGEKAVQSLRERQEKAGLKASIRKTAGDFSQALQGTRSGVPKELVQEVAEICSMLDFHTDRTGPDGEATKASLRLDALKVTYDKLKNDPDYDYASEYDAVISAQIGQLGDVLKGKRVTDLSLDELSDLDTLLKEIKHTISYANKQIGIGEALENRELGAKMIAEFQAQPDMNTSLARKALAGIASQALNPMRVARLISDFDENAQFYKTFAQLNDGIHKMDKFTMNATKLFEELTSGKGNTRLFYEFAAKPVDTGMKYADGGAVLLPKSMICETILLWERAQGRRHLEEGGLTIPNLKLYAKGRFEKAFAEGHRRI